MAKIIKIALNPESIKSRVKEFQKVNRQMKPCSRFENCMSRFYGNPIGGA